MLCPGSGPLCPLCCAPSIRINILSPSSQTSSCFQTSCQLLSRSICWHGSGSEGREYTSEIGQRSKNGIFFWFMCPSQNQSLRPWGWVMLTIQDNQFLPLQLNVRQIACKSHGQENQSIIGKEDAEKACSVQEKNTFSSSYCRSGTVLARYFACIILSVMPSFMEPIISTINLS